MSAVEEQENAVDIVALRAELKAWQAQFIEVNGRRAERADIKRDATITAKYKLYERISRKSRVASPPANHAESNPVLREQRPSNAVSATPKKTPSKARHVACLPPDPSPNPTPAHIRLALGPTPQKDGHVLGIFDSLPRDTPCKSDVKATNDVRDIVAATPSKANHSSSDQTFSKTPQSVGKRFFLDSFAGTPTGQKRKREEEADKITTTSSSKYKFATPAFLRRSFPLAKIDEENDDVGAARPLFKKRPLVRSLSSIIQGLRKQEEERMDDELDALREMEEEELGGNKESQKVLVKDSQTVEMPLGPDQAAESSEESAAEGEGIVRKPWKKKGLKRQTRRVIMRPVMHKAKKVEEAEESEVEVVAETQLQDESTKVGEDDEFADGTDFDGSHKSSTARMSKAKAKKKTKEKKSTGKKDKEKDKEKETATDKKSRKINPNALAHANFRSLKIKNKNSKAGGRGRKFGRR